MEPPNQEADQGVQDRSRGTGLPAERGSPPNRSRSPTTATVPTCSASKQLRHSETPVHQRWPGHQHIMADHGQRLQCRRHETSQHQATNRPVSSSLPHTPAETAARLTAALGAGQNQKQKGRTQDHHSDLRCHVFQHMATISSDSTAGGRPTQHQLPHQAIEERDLFLC